MGGSQISAMRSTAILSLVRLACIHIYGTYATSDFLAHAHTYTDSCQKQNLQQKTSCFQLKCYLASRLSSTLTTSPIALQQIIEQRQYNMVLCAKCHPSLLKTNRGVNVLMLNIQSILTDSLTVISQKSQNQSTGAQKGVIIALACDWVFYFQYHSKISPRLWASIGVTYPSFMALPPGLSQLQFWIISSMRWKVWEVSSCTLMSCSQIEVRCEGGDAQTLKLTNFVLISYKQYYLNSNKLYKKGLKIVHQAPLFVCLPIATSHHYTHDKISHPLFLHIVSDQKLDGGKGLGMRLLHQADNTHQKV